MNNGCRIRSLRIEEVDAFTIASWEDLEQRSLEGNAFLSPSFVIPAMRHLAVLEERQKALLVFVEKTTASKEVIGAAIFEESPGTLNFPVPHLKAFRSMHSYLSGLLLDRNSAREAARALFEFFCRKTKWHGVDFVNLPADGPQAGLLEEAFREFGARWHQTDASYRAVFKPTEGGESYLNAHLPARRLKEMRRLLRRLGEGGRVNWKATFGFEVGEATVERFLECEHKGWKGTKRTSLRSKASHENFFREMIHRFRERDQLFFTELSVGDHIIASNVNLISGGTGFAFKISHDPDFAQFAPGLLNEYEFIRRSPDLTRSLTYVDSGADEGSFIDRLWVGRRALVSGFLGTSLLGNGVLSQIGRLRRIKRRYFSPRDRRDDSRHANSVLSTVVPGSTLKHKRAGLCQKSNPPAMRAFVDSQ